MQKRSSGVLAKILAFCLVGAIVAFGIVMTQSDRTSKPMPINGDMLGATREESADAYKLRVEATLLSAADPAFALVTFREVLQPGKAAAVVEQADIQRVSAMVIPPGPPQPLAEPATGMSRQQVFQGSIDRLAKASDLPSEQLPGLSAVVVWDNGEHLRALAEQSEVFAIEVLPPDAAWGRFGVRPLSPEQIR